MMPGRAFYAISTPLHISVRACRQEPAVIDGLQHVNRSKHVSELPERSQEVVMIELPPILPHHAQPERTSTCMNKVRECDPTWHGRSADNEFVLSRSEVNL